ncbi:MAG: methylmalonyl Co-A mutase-associated GTPase MeaB, partial [Actinobacteria bacterium]|nr:methylmalonyl Co-A mutase-associated GTPase MeaB [Candidatus Fonsibacter lacus]
RDKEGAEKLRQDLLRSQDLSQRSDKWRAPVLLVSALDRIGISEVVSAISEHQDFTEQARG